MAVRHNGRLLSVITMVLVAHATASQPAAPSPVDSFVVVNNVKLHFVDWGGAGPALLFLTGLGDSAHGRSHGDFVSDREFQRYLAGEMRRFLPDDRRAQQR